MEFAPARRKRVTRAKRRSTIISSRPISEVTDGLVVGLGLQFRNELRLDEPATAIVIDPHAHSSPLVEYVPRGSSSPATPIKPALRAQIDLLGSPSPIIPLPSPLVSFETRQSLHADSPPLVCSSSSTSL
ncbi:hypothetical protein PM082_001933 [Marasmius tenuissimus]|nr:hypothetical protein PM082_001933 [Marasmius tenuissimus]